MANGGHSRPRAGGDPMPRRPSRPADSERHRGKANYAFVDGHSQLLPFAQTYGPPKSDLWNSLR